MDAPVKYGDLNHTSSNNNGKIFLCGGDNGETGPVPCRCKYILFVGSIMFFWELTLCT